MEIIQSYKFDLSAYKYEIRNNTLIIIPNELIKETIQEVTEPIITEPIITEPIQQKWKSDRNIPNDIKMDFKYLGGIGQIEKKNNEYKINRLIVENENKPVIENTFKTLNSVGTYLIKTVNVNRRTAGDVWLNFYIDNKRLDTYIKDRLNIH